MEQIMVNEEKKVSRKFKIKVIPVEVYSRIVGYYRPVQQWNPGKKEEFKQRKYLEIDKN